MEAMQKRERAAEPISRGLPLERCRCRSKASEHHAAHVHRRNIPFLYLKPSLSPCLFDLYLCPVLSLLARDFKARIDVSGSHQAPYLFPEFGGAGSWLRLC